MIAVTVASAASLVVGFVLEAKALLIASAPSREVLMKGTTVPAGAIILVIDLVIAVPIVAMTMIATATSMTTSAASLKAMDLQCTGDAEGGTTRLPAVGFGIV